MKYKAARRVGEICVQGREREERGKKEREEKKEERERERKKEVERWRANKGDMRPLSSPLLASPFLSSPPIGPFD